MFYQDFLFEDEGGHYRFSPSHSAENGWADNSTQDIAVAKELLTNVAAACDELRVEPQGMRKWKAMLAKMPPYLINQEGALQEWASPEKGESYDHHHNYPADCLGRHHHHYFRFHEVAGRQAQLLRRAGEPVVAHLRGIASGGDGLVEALPAQPGLEGAHENERMVLVG